MAIEHWYDFDDDRNQHWPEDSDTFMGALEAESSFLGNTSVAEDISQVIGSISKGGSDVITSIGDAKAGGGLSKTIGDTAVKVGLGIAAVLAVVILVRR